MTDPSPLSSQNNDRNLASTQDEIRQAVRANSVKRGIFILKSLAMLDVDGIIQQMEQLCTEYDKEIWRERAEDANISHAALDQLDRADPPVPYPYYFCLPGDLLRQPRLILYYRNVAMVSNKVMGNIGLDTTQHEIGLAISVDKAQAIAEHLNEINSELVLQGDDHNQRRHLELLYANLGASLDGGWRNEVGRLAYVGIISPLVVYLHGLNKIDSLSFKLKGTLALYDEESESGGIQTLDLQKYSTEDVARLLADLEEQRLVYRQLNLKNGNQVLLNRQFYWYDPHNTTRFRIGPDIIVQTPDNTFPWAAEVKGGADPAGSDEHWKTATRAFERIIEAADGTGRRVPRLTFMATILVDRVAQEALLWLRQGKLASVHNLTKIGNDPALNNEFLNQLVSFFEDK